MENKKSEKPYIIMPGTPDAMHIISVYSNLDDANKPVFSETFMK